jgi:predicted component of type VI protein secretion system
MAPEPRDPYLSQWSAAGEQHRWPLPSDGSAVIIGRSSSADVSVAGDGEISRVHATMERLGGQWTVVDDGLSRNGTFVNGRRLTTRVRLRDRDTIRVGVTVLTFCAPPQTVGDQTIVGRPLPALARMTEPQRAVLTALCRPYADGRAYATPASNQQIADELFLSLDAVKTHLRVLFGKFGIEALPQNQKRGRLAELAIELGLVSDSRA